MIRIEDDCVCCAEALGCLGDSCPRRNAAHYYCDRCGEETTLYDYHGEELCEECLLSEFKIIEGSECW